jgi:hypothetical protein
MIQLETSVPNPNPHPLTTLMYQVRQHWKGLALQDVPKGSAPRHSPGLAL